MLVFVVPGLAFGEIDFNRDIRPILSENCVHCHGPDEEGRKADLRLDTFGGATADLGGYAALVPGKPEDSELWFRVMTEDEGDVMPPPKSKRVLSDQQKKLLKEWIEGGGEFAEHWAYVAPVKEDVPSEYEGREVDYFVDRRLESVGMVAADRADRFALIRRVSLALTGLPPTPEEVDAFVADGRAGAYGRVVDRLLASERFGERWARPWLDLARYADSNGFQADQLRPSWAYRDWVINALNENMPFDQFTIEQLAGDLLPGATVEQRVATGFHRTVTCNVEAGVHPEQNRTNQVVDRVNTTGTVWLGTTMECAQCHDHKYDPFSMKEYYELFAFFNNTPLEVSLPSGTNDVSHDFVGPFMDLPLDAERAAELEVVEGELAEWKKKRAVWLKRPGNSEKEREAALVKSVGQEVRWEVLKPVKVSGTGQEDFLTEDDGSVLATGRVPDTTVYRLEFEGVPAGVRAIRLEALTDKRIPGKGPGRGDALRTNFVLHEFGVEAGGKGLRLLGARADFSQERWDVSGAIDGKPKTGWAIAPEFGKPHWAVFRFEKPFGGGDLAVTLDQNFGRGRVLGKVRISVSRDAVGAVDLAEDVVTILRKPAEKRSGGEKRKVKAALDAASPELVKMDGEIEKLERRMEGLKPERTLVMVEMEEARETHVMLRGDYLAKGEKVSAGVPGVLPGMGEDVPRNRLGLAQWLVDGRNPLVARVVVNRWWAEVFGQGIVRTEEDLGTQSEPPTHPGLLDWLAVEFVESGWDMKHVLREMVMSEAFCRSSVVREDLAEKDPENRLLARGVRFRMDAERIRDNALAVSGLLSTKMFGEPVMPYQPPGIWRQVGRNEPKWVEQKDENRWRRGIYIVYRRAAPYPSMVSFDAPDRGACTVQRARTNTPMQALTMLNDPSFVEMAVALGDRVLVEVSKGGDAARIDYLFKVVLSRPVRAAEREVLLGVLEKRRKQYAAAEEETAAMVKGAARFYKVKSEDVVELAAWVDVAQVLLNLDETITQG